MQRRRVHCYHMSHSDQTTLVIHYQHRMYVPSADTRMTTCTDVQVKYIPEDDTLLVTELWSDPKRVSFRPFENLETWTLRTDV